jgi:LysW-gamma-L-lysine carboxypeptidase
MLECPSPTGRERGVCELLIERFRAAGLPARRDEAGNFVGVVGDGPVEVALLGHIDTVPGDIPVVERDGRLYGRGAVDAKGPMAAFVSATLRLSGSPTGRGAGGNPSPLRRLRLLVIGAVGEEGESPGARHLAGRLRPRHLIIGEPSGWDSLVLGYKGSLRLRYAVERPASHSAGREPSTPEVALRVWEGLKALAGEHNEGKRVFDQLSPSLRAFNTSGDGLRDRAELEVNVRLPLGYGPERLDSRLRELAPEGRLEVYFGEPAVKGGKNNPLVRGFLAALREAGAQPRFKVKTGTSDMNVVGPAWACPMVAYGPGDSTLDHTPEEHIELEEYDRAIGVLEAALKRLDDMESERS